MTTCPVKDHFSLHESPYITHDQVVTTRSLVSKQCREIHGVTVTCSCGKTVRLAMAFRCYFCGVWFCPTCAKEHFGVPEGWERPLYPTKESEAK